MTRDYRANPNSRLGNKIRGFCKPRPIGSTWFIENDRYEIFNRQIFISIKGRALDSQPLQQSVTSVWFDLTAITGQRLRYIALYRINVCANRVSVHRLAARQTLMDENYIFTRLLTRLRVTLSHQLWNLCCSIERVDGRVTSFERVARLDKKGEKEAREKENSNKIQQSATLRLKEIQCGDISAQRLRYFASSRSTYSSRSKGDKGGMIRWKEGSGADAWWKIFYLFLPKRHGYFIALNARPSM